MGTVISSDPSPIGEGDTPSPNPTASAPTNRLDSRAFGARPAAPALLPFAPHLTLLARGNYRKNIFRMSWIHKA